MGPGQNSPTGPDTPYDVIIIQTANTIFLCFFLRRESQVQSLSAKLLEVRQVFFIISLEICYQYFCTISALSHVADELKINRNAVPSNKVSEFSVEILYAKD